MPQLAVSALADADAAAILNDLAAKGGHRLAIKYAARIARLFEMLTEFPTAGVLRPALGPAIRISVMSPYVVVHRYSEATETVIVLRIVHGRRRISGSLLADFA